MSKLRKHCGFCNNPNCEEARLLLDEDDFYLAASDGSLSELLEEVRESMGIDKAEIFRLKQISQ